jgi:very-short-patch-repair endonuclease
MQPILAVSEPADQGSGFFEPSPLVGEGRVRGLSETRPKPCFDAYGEGERAEMKHTLTHRARSLRNNQTFVEAILWRRLKARQIEDTKFRRQGLIGPFIVDFVSFEKHLIIELDGGQHAQTHASDAERDLFLAQNGFTVVRFWNNEVIEDLEAVLEVIREACLK